MAEEKKQPTDAEVEKWYEKQIKLAKMRHELTKLQSETVQFEAARLTAMEIVAKYTMEDGPQKENDSDSQGLDEEKKK